MVNLVDTILGSESKAKTKKQPTLTDEQRQALDTLISELGGGEISAEGISSGEKSIVDEIMSRRGGQQNLVGDAQSRIGELLGSRDEFDEFFRTNVEQPLMERFEEDIIPGIGRRFGGAGFFSSERRAAEQDAMGELAQELTAGRSRSAIEAPLSAVSSLGDVFGVQKGLDDFALEASGFDRQVREQQRQRRIQEILQALGIPAFENITTVTPGQEGILGPAAKGFAAGFGSTF